MKESTSIKTLLISAALASMGCTELFPPKEDAPRERTEELEDCRKVAKTGLSHLLEAEARASKYKELFDSALRADTNNDRCNDLRRFLSSQLPRHDATSDTGYLFRFGFYAFFGKCLVRDAKNDKMYAITAENVELAMFLNKEGNLRIPPMKKPEDQ